MASPRSNPMKSLCILHFIFFPYFTFIYQFLLNSFGIFNVSGSSKISRLKKIMTIPKHSGNFLDELENSKSWNKFNHILVVSLFFSGCPKFFRYLVVSWEFSLTIVKFQCDKNHWSINHQTSSALNNQFKWWL